MKTNELFSEARRASGKSIAQVADEVGISDDSYRDVELHEDEFVSVLTLREGMDLCRVLGVDLLRDVLGRSSIDYQEEPLNELISRKRASLGMSASALAEKIGFDEAAVVAMERDPDFLQGWSVELITDLEIILETALLQRVMAAGDGA